MKERRKVKRRENYEDNKNNRRHNFANDNEDSRKIILKTYR